MIAAIENRRSIRKFLDMPLDKKDITQIIRSGIKAPSSKNRQPWKFTVVQGSEKEKALEAFCRGILREETGDAILPNNRNHVLSARNTIEIMEQAPVVVFVENTLGESVLKNLTPEERIAESCNIQSIGAAIENMILTATEKGIGSLWICDIYFAYAELCEWLGSDSQLVAAVAFGYPAESPDARPRKPIDDVVVWRN